jgi:hypothetical protein
MATSSINTECKRYGCMKNLLACYANCRYNSRCDELRKEIESKSEQAALDINTYLSSIGKGPIAIQFPKRGLKFIEANQKKPEIKKRLASISKPSPPRLELKKSAGGIKKRATAKGKKRYSEMSRKAKQNNKETPQRTTEMTNKADDSGNPSESPRPVKAAGRRGPQKARAASKARKGKVYIIIEGRTANIVDEKGLMTHLFNNSAGTARYFEATEVEARVQIVPKP